MEQRRKFLACKTNTFMETRDSKSRKTRKHDRDSAELETFNHTRISLTQTEATVAAAQAKTALAMLTIALSRPSSRAGPLQNGGAVATPRKRGLRDCALALLPSPVSSSSSGQHPEQLLLKLLEQMTIRRPHTVQLMLQHLEQGRAALLSLAPCQVSLSVFEQKSRYDSMARLFYKVVQEAVRQCDQVTEFYLKFQPNDRLTGRMLPPFASYERCPVLQELSDGFWEEEDSIQGMHRQAKATTNSSNNTPLDPGFAVECVAMLCHAFEATGPSPIGLNFFHFD